MRRRARGLSVLWIGLLAGVLLLQAGPIHGGTTRFSPAREFRAFDLPALAGGRHALADFRGRPVLLSVWATWCAPCRQELPQFQRARDELRDEHPDAVFLTVNLGDGGARVQGFLTRVGLDLPVLLAGQNFVEQYGIRTIPTLFVLDRDGKLASLHEGWGPDIDLPAALAEDLSSLDRPRSGTDKGSR
ncbi:MAG: TlpA family protein disulfide reductase [Acidobacteriota bacterium]